MKRTLAVLGIVGAVLFVSGCDKTKPKYKPVDVTQTVKVPARGLERPKNKEKPEYDCRKHARDKICEVPWKDKIVLYCYADKIPRVVRYREDCH